MPLVAHTPLPIYDDLEKLGQEVLSLDRALKQDIRELHIGLLNMMPDAALQITERQFLRLIGSSNKIVQFYVHPFTIPGLGRSVETEAYVRKYYNTFEEIQEMGLDALIVSGANPKHASLELESFWEPLQEVMAWASDNVTSVLCSCLASHAHLKFEHGIQRKRMIHKKWGVFSHRVRNRQHPLLADVNTRFDTPHSRWNEVTADDLEAAGLHILVDSDEAGVHLATSKDQFRVIYFQGHPEYLGNSLLKEYKRDLLRYLNDVSEEEPPFPHGYISEETAGILNPYLAIARAAKARGETIPDFPESAVSPLLDNTWGDTGKAIFNNWIGLVYKLTSQERHVPFMEQVDPNDPLNLRQNEPVLP